MRKTLLAIAAVAAVPLLLSQDATKKKAENHDLGFKDTPMFRVCRIMSTIPTGRILKW